VRPVIVAYRPDWPQRAARLAASLREALAPLPSLAPPAGRAGRAGHVERAGRVEHIGSTSIPGMAAKDILDMQVSVADLEQAAEAFDQPLAGLGFERSPYQSDHVPAGLDDDPGRWAKRLWLRRGQLGDVNLHVRLSGSPNERLALLFRDWFRAHPDAIAGYAAFKVALAAIAPDMDTYSDIKDPVVDVVIAAAEEWAAAVGWRP
jgi:GrpB-like predicted nucleotidyltransferase (UPF0157 family)